MMYKTIKISEEKYRWLLNIMAELQKERGKRISFDDALDNVIKEKNERKTDIMELAGAWSYISNKEWRKNRSSLDKMWRKWKIKSL